MCVADNLYFLFPMLKSGVGAAANLLADKARVMPNDNVSDIRVTHVVDVALIDVCAVLVLQTCELANRVKVDRSNGVILAVDMRMSAACVQVALYPLPIVHVMFNTMQTVSSRVILGELDFCFEFDLSHNVISFVIPHNLKAC